MRALILQGRRFISVVTIAVFLLTSVGAPAYAQGVMTLPGYGVTSPAATGFVPVSLKAIQVRVDEPLVFDFVIDTGSATLSQEELKAETEKLAKYFLATVTLPEKELWVNLSPYEQDRIIPDGLGATEMGRVMLAQDKVLKELSSSIIHPDSELGKTFWARIYSKTQEVLGATDIPMEVFNKVWIVPQSANVYEMENTALLGTTTLKVMMEEDMQATAINNEAGTTVTDADRIASIEAFRSIILPEIEKEVNTGKDFAPLRQVYGAMVLATWYKKALKDGLLGQVYADQSKTSGVETLDKNAKQDIYDAYVDAFKQGAFNFIHEDADPVTGQVTPRQYFSGGEKFADNLESSMHIVTVVGKDIPEDGVRASKVVRATIVLAKPGKTDEAEKISRAFQDAFIAKTKIGQAVVGLVKPDGQPYEDALIQEIRSAGLKVTVGPRIRMSPEDVQKFYAEHYEVFIKTKGVEKAWWPSLETLMTSGWVTPLFIEGEDAVKIMTDLKIRVRQDGENKYGKQNSSANRLHGSDKNVSAEREAGLVFEMIEVQEQQTLGVKFPDTQRDSAEGLNLNDPRSREEIAALVKADQVRIGFLPQGVMKKASLAWFALVFDEESTRLGLDIEMTPFVGPERMTLQEAEKFFEDHRGRIVNDIEYFRNMTKDVSSGELSWFMLQAGPSGFPSKVAMQELKKRIRIRYSQWLHNTNEVEHLDIDDAPHISDSIVGDANAVNKDWANLLQMHEARQNKKIDNSATQREGGINFDAALLDMQITRTGTRVTVTVDPALIERIKTEGVDGFAPVVINMMPVTGVLAAVTGK